MLVLCSDVHGFCSDLMDASTGVRDGLHVRALEGSEIPFRPLCLKETGTEGRCSEGTGTAVKDGSDFSDLGIEEIDLDLNFCCGALLGFYIVLCALMRTGEVKVSIDELQNCSS